MQARQTFDSFSLISTVLAALHGERSSESPAESDVGPRWLHHVPWRGRSGFGWGGPTSLHLSAPLDPDHERQHVARRSPRFDC